MDRQFLHSTELLIYEFPAASAGTVWPSSIRANWSACKPPFIHGLDLTHKHLQEHLVLWQAGACMTTAAENSDGAYSVQTLHLLPEPVLYPTHEYHYDMWRLLTRSSHPHSPLMLMKHMQRHGRTMGLHH